MQSKESSSSLQQMSSARFGNYPSQRSTSTEQHSSLRPASSVLNVCLLKFAMPLGCFQHMMSVTFGHLGPESGILTYMDDITYLSEFYVRSSPEIPWANVFSVTGSRRNLEIDETSIRSEINRVPWPCHFGKGISISADRIKAILALPEPDCIKDNRGFLGTLNYVRRFIDGYA